MKKYYTPSLIISIVLLIAVLCVGATTETRQMGFSVLRALVTADDTVLDGTTDGYTYSFGDKPQTVIKLHEYWNNVQIYFTGKDAADETCNFKLYAWRENGPAVLVCSGSFTLGTAVTGTANQYYADTISVTDLWPTELLIRDSGNNRVCTLTFDALGFHSMYCEIDIPASSQVASASAYISGF